MRRASTVQGAVLGLQHMRASSNHGSTQAHNANLILEGLFGLRVCNAEAILCLSPEALGQRKHPACRVPRDQRQTAAYGTADRHGWQRDGRSGGSGYAVHFIPAPPCPTPGPGQPRPFASMLPDLSRFMPSLRSWRNTMGTQKVREFFWCTKNRYRFRFASSKEFGGDGSCDQAEEAVSAPAAEELLQRLRRVGLLRAPAQEEPVQGLRRVSHLRAPAHPEQVQGLRRVGLLRAPAHPEHVQGVRRGQHLRAPAHPSPVH